MLGLNLITQRPARLSCVQWVFGSSEAAYVCTWRTRWESFAVLYLLRSVTRYRTATVTGGPSSPATFSTTGTSIPGVMSSGTTVLT